MKTTRNTGSLAFESHSATTVALGISIVKIPSRSRSVIATMKECIKGRLLIGIMPIGLLMNASISEYVTKQTIEQKNERINKCMSERRKE